MPEHRAKFIYSAYLVRGAYAAYLWRRSATLIVVSPMLLLWSLFELKSGDYAWPAGFIGGATVLLWGAWIGGYRRSAQTAAALGNPEVELLATEEAVTFRMPHAMSVVEWPGIATLLRLRRFWIFVRVGMVNPSFVPVEAMGPEMRAFIEGKIRQAGGRVR